MSEAPARSLLPRIAAVCAVVALLALGVSRTLLGGDTFFYLAAGEHVLTHGLPDGDPFAYTSRPGRWVLHFPLLQVGFALVERTVGLVGLRVIGGVTAGLALCALWLARGRTSAERLLLALPVVLFVLLSVDHFSVRGQTFGTLFLAALIALLERMRDGYRPAFFIPVLAGAVWTNTHPSFVLLVALPLAVAVATRLDPPAERPPLRPLLVFAALALLACGLTPYGYGLALSVARMMAGGGAARIDLFLPPELRDPLVVGALAATLALAWARLFVGGRHARSDAFLLIATAFGFVYARRYLVLLIAFQGVALLPVARAFLKGRDLPARAHAVLAAGLAAAAAMSLATPRDELELMPERAATFIQERGVPDGLLNNYVWGGYLAWRFAGEPKVFIDGRVSVFPPSVLSDYLRLKYVGEGWEELLDIYGVGSVVWRPGRPLARALDEHPGWRRVYEDDEAAIWVRAETPGGGP